MTKYAIVEKNKMLERDRYRCFNCGKQGHERGHVIKNSKPNIKIFGSLFLDHYSNVKTACENKACNSAAEVGESDSIDRNLHIVNVYESMRLDNILNKTEMFQEILAKQKLLKWGIT